MKRATITSGMFAVLALMLSAGMVLDGVAAEGKKTAPVKTEAKEPADQSEPAPADADADVPAAKDGEMPYVIRDESADDWVVDRFAGNSTSGSLLFQGPAREAGGLGVVKMIEPMPDGSVYLLGGAPGVSVNPLLKVTKEGMILLVMGSEGLLEGPMEQCQAGRPVWNPKEKMLYITGPNCLRRIVEKPDGTRWVEIVAGIPDKAGNQNGPAREATFQSRYRGVVCNAAGVFYWLEDKGLRRIENGVVSSVKLNFNKETPTFAFAMGGSKRGLLCLGENDDILYLSDYYGFRVLRCDMKSGDVTRVIGMSKGNSKRYGRNSDGPALTHASANSGMVGTYDAFHKAIWMHGPDEDRFRCLRLDGDGWVRTVFGSLKPGTKAGKVDANGVGIPGDQFRSMWNMVCGFDAKGGVYVSHTRDGTGVWRAYNKKEAVGEKTEGKLP